MQGRERTESTIVWLQYLTSPQPSFFALNPELRTRNLGLHLCIDGLVVERH